MSEEGKYDRNNSTCSLDLSKDWTNSSVRLTCTERPAKALALNTEALWFDKKRNFIYCFGGDMSFANGYHVTAPMESIWAFTPDEKGAGNWQEVLGPTGLKPFPSHILRPSTGVDASDESYGYYFGGFVNRATSRSLTDERVLVPGLLTLNFTDLTITNTSEGVYGYGQMVDVPSYGTSGVLILLGKGTWSDHLPFNTISIYDKTKQIWYSQLASGAIPDPRINYCIVGIRGIESDTFEIFLYGGVINNLIGPDTVNSDQVYILSIPAFRWFQAVYPPAFSRATHTCHTTNTNQMIVIGGVDHTNDTIFLGSADLGAEPRDPWAQGIGVFDMTTLKFKDSYESKAKPYEPPEVIKSFYSDKSKRYPATWTSSAVQKLFQMGSKSDQVPNATDSQVPRTASSSTATDSQVPRPINSSIPRPILSPAAIIGISISVSVVCGSFCAIATFSITKRIKKNQTIPSIIRTELPTTERPNELPASIEPVELLNRHKDRTELHGSGTIELF
ncbi:hypothetical protein MMC31_007322 [Peltigera leucophlebia]|nr:hypothetical protein [Peltigera leucophlebia]